MFKIQVNNNNIAYHQINKEISKVPARNLLKEKSMGAISSIDSEYSSYVKFENNRVDMSESVLNAKKYKKDYERTLPENLSPETKNIMWVKAKELKDKFTIGMLSREEMHPVKGFLDNGTMKWVVDEEKMRSNRTVEREQAWQKNNDNNIREFKNIMRHLNPDDPNAGDVEKYRPKGGKG